MPRPAVPPLLLVALLLAAAVGEWEDGEREEEGRGGGQGEWERERALRNVSSRLFLFFALPPLPGSAAAAKPRLTTTPDGRVVNEKGVEQRFYGVNWFGFNTE